MIEPRVKKVLDRIVSDDDFNELSVEQVYALRNLITKVAEKRRNDRSIERNRRINGISEYDAIMLAFEELDKME